MGLIRPRLLARLDRSRGAGLAVIAAPAGFGKTTLLAQAAHRHTGPVAWLSIAPADAAEGRLTELIAAAVSKALAADSGDLLLVIDNAHHALGTPDETILAELASFTPDNTYVLLAGRQLPAHSLLRHEVAGYFEVLGPEQLRFRPWEVERLLADVYGEALPPDDAALLTRRTGGWAAGLAMFHVSTRGRPLQARQRAVAALSERWDLTRGYLARTVLAELRPELREFLVRTSVFDVVTASRCDRLLATTGSARVLDELSSHHALPVTSDAGEYQYHQVLRSHLLAALVDDLGEQQARAWHHRAAQLLVAEPAHAEAARSFARAGDWRGVGTLLSTLGAEVAETPEEPLADLLPAWLLAEDPWLAYAEAKRRLYDGQLEAARDGLLRAAELFGDDAGRASQHERQLAAIFMPEPPPGRTHWASWVRALTLAHPHEVGVEAAVLTGPEGELVRILADFLAGDTSSAMRRASRPMTATWPDDSFAGLALRVTRAAIQVMHGPDPQLRAQCTLDLVQLADEADAAGWPWLSRVARAATGLSGDPVLGAEASTVADECDRRGDRWGAAVAQSLGLLHDRRVGRLTTAAALQLLQRCEELNAPVMQAWARVSLSLASVAEQAPDSVERVRELFEAADAAGVPAAKAVMSCVLERYEVATAQALIPRRPSAQVPHTPAARWLDITCFGSFRLEIDGRPVDLSGVRARARSALRLLATHAGQQVHREVLIEALWPDLTPAAATRNLQVTISALRGLLDRATGPGRPSLLVRSGGSYGLALPPGGYCDVVAFHDAVGRWRRLRGGPDRAAEIATLREALAAYGAELLPEEGPAEWAVAAREQVDRQATEASRALAEAELARGHVGEAITAAEHSLSLDRTDDKAWQVLLEGYERAGAPAKAAQVRKRYAAMLTDLGLDAATVGHVSGVNGGENRT
ncbi:BTAD domain-containing putative transcriptional regulator [Virgisporangium aliadipatigenens]|uniref:BTAD domain-containing putative transcriptional regulator n=1 Tax=Virgisporangium aliadipatigenens TaxID=741659 RepID=UPI001943247A|nr:BTAD domain-containing putative transcriptional regulator [Virgisporangium aliadipatigenens]